MGRKRPHIHAADLDTFFEPGNETAKLPTAYERKYPAHTYRVGDGLHEELKRIAAQEGVGLNELVRWWLGQFVRRYNAGEVELPITQYRVSRTRLGG